MTDTEYDKLCAEVERDRRQTKERLERNLAKLESYCRPVPVPVEDIIAVAKDVIPVNDPERDSVVARIRHGLLSDGDLCYWPTTELLCEMNDDAIVLADQWRVRLIFPFWETFCRLDKQVKKLRLKKCVDDLIGRARNLLPGESELSKVLRLGIEGNAQDQCAYRDIVLDQQKLAELIRDDRQIVVEQHMAFPLVFWACTLGHPFAKDLGRFGKFFPTNEEIKARQRREKTRVRVLLHRRRHRLAQTNPDKLKKNRRKSVTRF